MPYANREDLRAFRKEYDKRPENVIKRRDRMRKWLERNPEYMSQWQQDNKARPQLAAWRTAYKAAGKQRENDYRRLYGISVSDYDLLLQKQGGLCAICRKPPNGKTVRTRSLHVDHHHTSGKVRGLLCVACNVHLGWLENRQSNVMGYLKTNG